MDLFGPFRSPAPPEPTGVEIIEQPEMAELIDLVRGLAQVTRKYNGNFNITYYSKKLSEALLERMTVIVKDGEK